MFPTQEIIFFKEKKYSFQMEILINEEEIWSWGGGGVGLAGEVSVE